MFAVAYAHEPPRHYELPSLSKLIGEVILASIQGAFADNVGGSILLAEATAPGESRRIDPLPRRGEELGNHMRNDIEFCRELRHHVSADGVCGDRLCRQCEDEFIAEVLGSRDPQPVWNYCWCGFVEYCAPILIEEHIVGAIYSGQRRYVGTVHSAETDRSRRLQTKASRSPPDVAKLVKAACEELDLDAQHFLDMAQSDLVPAVSDAGIREELARIDGLAHDIGSLAQAGYRAQTTIQEQRLLDMLWSIFAEGVGTVDERESTIWTILDCVLRELKRFMGCTIGVFFLSADGLNEFRPVAGDVLELRKEKRDHLRMPRCLLDKGVLDRQAFHAVNLRDDVDPPPTKDQIHAARRMLKREDMGASGFLGVSVEGDRRGVLMVTKTAEEAGTSSLSSVFPQGREFFSGLARTLGQGLDMAMTVSSTKRHQIEREREMLFMAHEINLPIQSMLADTHNLAEELPAQFDLKEIAGRTLNETKALHLRVQTLLHALSKIGAKERHVFTLHSIYRPLKEACDMFESEARDKGCSIRGPRSLGGDFPEIEMSRVHLTLAFKNLVGNAVKYSFRAVAEPELEEGRGRERFVRVTGYFPERQTEQYVVEISNFGVGITSDEIDQGLVYMRGYRGKLAADRHRTGAGLGLAYAKHVIQGVHEGSIGLTSVHKGGDAYLTTFRVVLPLTQSKDEENSENA
jgi:signal transduction histidine kinase